MVLCAEWQACYHVCCWTMTNFECPEPQFNMNSTEKKLNDIVTDIARNASIKGIVLGGSRGFGFADDASDYDVNLYYDDLSPVSNENLLRGLTMDCNGLQPIRSGRRMSGELNGLRVEFFYHNITNLQKALAEVSNARFSLLPDRWFPQGKLTTDALSILVYGQLLHDRDGVLKAIVEAAVPMNHPFQKLLYEFAMTGAETALKNMRKARKLPDHSSHLMSHVFLFVWYSEICLFALNGKYPFSSKQTALFLSKLSLSPVDYLQRISKTYRSAASATPHLAFAEMQSILGEIVVSARRTIKG